MCVCGQLYEYNNYYYRFVIICECFKIIIKLNILLILNTHLSAALSVVNRASSEVASFEC